MPTYVRIYTLMRINMNEHDKVQMCEKVCIFI